MTMTTFTWPNNARVAFVLGIAFEAWDKPNQPPAGRCKGDRFRRTQFAGAIIPRRLTENSVPRSACAACSTFATATM